MNKILRSILSKLRAAAGGLPRRVNPSAYHKSIFMEYISRLNADLPKTPKAVKEEVPFIVIEESNKCNLNCVMCRTNNSTRARGEMSKDLFRRILVEKKRLGQKLVVMHTVNEPLLCSYFEDVLKMCAQYGMYLVLTTNGLLIKEHIGILKKYPRVVRFIGFSVDGATKETYEFIRKGASFESLIENLELVRDYNKNWTRRIPVDLRVCLSKDNFDEIPLFFKTYGKYFNPEQINFSFLTNLSSQHASKEYFLGSIPVRNNFYRLNCPCNLLWGQIHILFDGKISACCRDYNGELIVGDIAKDSILDAWNSEAYEKLRQKNLSGNVHDVPLCGDCYIIDKQFTAAFNSYVKYILTRYGDRSHEYFMNKIRNFLLFFDALAPINKHSNRDLVSLL